MSEKVTPGHQQRLAVVYIRQSSPGQVKNHRESYRAQKGLANRATALGWRSDRVKLIEGDQGESASHPHTRDEFNLLLELVRDQQVGIVFGIDVARLARNTLDWSLLTHWCALHGALLGDHDNVYDPSLPHDSFVLGIQGVLAVHELHSIRNRMQAGLREKASRGELHLGVPRGYVVVDGKHLRKHPDRRIQRVIQRTFEQFTKWSSAGQLVSWMWDQNETMPRPLSSGDGMQVEWVEATQGGLVDMLRNPKYAGVYAYPRYRQETTMLPCGKLKKLTRLARVDEWEIVLKDHHPAYITFEQYEANQQKLDMNAQRLVRSVGAPNKGASLLAGLIECRRCGHKMRVHYGSSGKTSYSCSRGRRQRDKKSSGCFHFVAEELERKLSEQVLYAVGPAGVRAAELAAEHMASERDARRENLSDQLAQLCYEADLTRRRFNEVDPANSLVFQTLSNELESALQAVAEQESKLQQFDREEPPCPTQEERAILEELGGRLEEVWYAPQADGRLKQQVVRLLIEHVTADLDEARDEVVLWVKWAGGHHTELRAARRRVHWRRARVDIQSVMDTLRKIANDESISRALNRAGVHSDGGKTWTRKRVSQYRQRAGVARFDASLKEQEGWLTQQEAATYLEISPMSINRLIQQGILPAEGLSRLPQVIRRDDLANEEVQVTVRQIKSHGNAPLPRDPNQKTLFS